MKKTALLGAILAGLLIFPSAQAEARSNISFGFHTGHGSHYNHGYRHYFGHGSRYGHYYGHNYHHNSGHHFRRHHNRGHHYATVRPRHSSHHGASNSKKTGDCFWKKGHRYCHQD